MHAAPATGAHTSEINVTPMIDVLLVLLIIFMLILPSTRQTIDLQIPEPQPGERAESGPQIVLEVGAGGRFALNSHPVAAGRLAAELRATYADRPTKVLFVKGDPAARYQDIISAMDVARGAGVKVIGIAPRDLPR